MAGEKPFEATPSRLERARREGDMPRSTDLTGLTAFAGGALGLFLASPLLVAAARTALGEARDGRHALAPLGLVGIAALVPATFALAGAVIARRAHAGRLTFLPPKLDFSRLNPASGLKTIFSRDTAIAATKAIVAASAVALGLVPILAGMFAQGVRGGTPESLGAQAMRGATTVIGVARAVGFAFALADAALESHKWRRRLRMSLDELKRDLRQSEGDPLLRRRRRSAHGGLVRGSVGRLHEAAFVVANPNHIAIALAYKPPEIAVPRVVVRAVEEGARFVRRRAIQLGIPVIEDVALARSLFAATEPGAFIPRELYADVARIVAALLAQRRLPE